MKIRQNENKQGIGIEIAPLTIQNKKIRDACLFKVKLRTPAKEW